ncbi:hypothetical protein [Duganella qianjiadongensis]|uniref:Uncharacterized protein n=1 Tax=Duganella qianjiadongensis TaxID=2692176 RepID=A0ABW9VDN6_9BURK|nr:hypothetical protein [Duganella qianjiadongensis]MYM37738.1 hypothetical protein [Duganella qianjiadongensis]
MSMAIGSSTSTQYTPAAQVNTAAPANVAVDADGDHDGSKAGEIEPAKAVSGSVGTIINTKA